MELNEEQKKAIAHVNGPLLILAGAGSGKTRVLTERIANLIANESVAPYNILAVTFTNKAAKEMKERISLRLGEALVKSLWIGTFHSICSRILRSEIHLLGRTANFVIYDSADQAKLITQGLKKANLDEKMFSPNKVLSSISKAKSSGMTAEQYVHQHLSLGEQRIGDLYLYYEENLKKNNALDFDDMLFYVVRIFREFPERLQHYQKKFKYIMVDEYQDTNLVQYELINQLGSLYRNVCVVGDVDQSIYSFRNADFRIILNFQKDYPNARVITLEKNYRSTKNILSLSNEIIKENKSRFPKNLTTDNETGEKTRIYEARDDDEEVRFILREMFRLMEEKNYDYKDFTILYRTNAQSRIFEEYFVRNNIPHQIVGGFRFFERKEIKDIISYLKVIFNPDDSISLQRIINIPKRSIGNTTVEKLLDTGEKYHLSLWDVLNFQNFENISPATQKSIREFVATMNELIANSNTNSVSRLIQLILTETGYIRELEKEDQKSGKDKDNSRVENVYQLVNSAVDFETKSDDVSLEAYLNYVSLVSDADDITEKNNIVKLMTVHTAKGLEFPVVFITGMAEGIFPHFNSAQHDELEEERRLMYVAVTRAQKLLFLTFPRKRFMYGSSQSLVPSKFISECPPHLVYGYNVNQLGHQKSYEDNNRGEKKQHRLFYEDDYQESSFRKKKPEPEPEPEFSSDDYDYRPRKVPGNDYAYGLKKSVKLDPQAIQASLESRYTSGQSKTSGSEEFSEGSRVRTAKFGLGTITKVLRNNQKLLLIINFDRESGSKIIDPKLTIVQKEE
jgi:DNA helicase-2/ATP-dependent DNA helicase PcrA